jgi:hypothetical protein
MFKKILVVLVIAVAVFAGVVAMQPAEFRVERSATMAAPAPDVFAQVNDFHNWEAWSPWAKLDPNAKVTFSGPQSGQGASFKWDGNGKVGAGTMTITASKPNERVSTRTDFVKPFEGTSNSEFVFSQVGERTNVIWTMTGTHKFIGKAMCLVMSMENMLGPDFEKGLAQLKQVAERK